MGTSVVEEPTTIEPTTPEPAAPAAPVVPETYDLKVPDGSTVDPALLERTAAKARVLGLSNEAAQTLLDSEVEDYTARETATKAATTKAADDAQKSLLAEWGPGGAQWKAQQDTWTQASKADPTIGGDKFNQTIEYAGKAVERFGDPELKGFLEETGFGRHPVVLRFLSKLGRASSESTMAGGGIPVGTGTKTPAQIMYPDS